MMFLVDSSESISESNYQQELSFISQILSSSKTSVPSWGSQIGTEVYVGTIIFDSTNWDTQNFIEATSYSAVNSFLNQAKQHQTGGTSNICGALDLASTYATDSSEYLGRSQVPKTLLLFTDGEPVDPTGQCTNQTFINKCTSLKNMGVEVMTIAVTGSNGNEGSENYGALKACASTVVVNQQTGQTGPLFFQMTDASSLTQIEDQITSNMGCCACEPDLLITAEVSEFTTNNAFLPQVFQTILDIQSAFCVSTDQYKSYVGLITYNRGNNTALRINGCNNNWASIMRIGCPIGISNSGSANCSWTGGESDISVAITTSESTSKQYNTKNLPNTNILMSTGACEDTNGQCKANYLELSVSPYQQQFPFRIGESLYVAGATNTSLLNKVIYNDDGTSGTQVVIQGTGFNGNPASISSQIVSQLQRWLSDQPGCKTRWNQ